MCGIVGVVSQKADVVAPLLSGLKHLEYRGYDSAGLCVIDQSALLQRLRVVGKVAGLEAALSETPLAGHIGIAHTRWATHGVAHERNAHPHLSKQEVAVVHNGIIEDYQPLKQQLIDQGYVFESETDTEVIAHAVHAAYQQHGDLTEAVQSVVALLKGAYALGVMHLSVPDQLVVARAGCPLVIGQTSTATVIASDVLALPEGTTSYARLAEGDVVCVQTDSIKKSSGGDFVFKPFVVNFDDTSLLGFDHYMQKEINEQSQSVAATVEAYCDTDQFAATAWSAELMETLSQVEGITFVACGTSAHAAWVAQYLFEAQLPIRCRVEIASEYRYREQTVPDNELFIAISQSGETLDTLEALRRAKTQSYLATLGISNVEGSVLTEETDYCLLTHAGREVSVASTKAFTAQLTVLAMLSMQLKLALGQPVEAQQQIQQWRSMPAWIDQVHGMSDAMQSWAEQLSQHSKVYFIARGVGYPVVQEGALKLKEISYIHAEAYAGGELKHGALALITQGVPVIACVQAGPLASKMIGNLQEVAARGAAVYVLHDPEVELPPLPNLHAVAMPMTLVDWQIPLLFTIALQWLAYHTANVLKLPIDQPRNLAKSVTVE